jgi:hypothetical protein
MYSAGVLLQKRENLPSSAFFVYQTRHKIISKETEEEGKINIEDRGRKGWRIGEGGMEDREGRDEG